MKLTKVSSLKSSMALKLWSAPFLCIRFLSLMQPSPWRRWWCISWSSFSSTPQRRATKTNDGCCRDRIETVMDHRGATTSIQQSLTVPMREEEKMRSRRWWRLTMKERLLWIECRAGGRYEAVDSSQLYHRGGMNGGGEHDIRGWCSIVRYPISNSWFFMVEEGGALSPPSILDITSWACGCAT